MSFPTAALIRHSRGWTTEQHPDPTIVATYARTEIYLDLSELEVGAARERARAILAANRAMNLSDVMGVEPRTSAFMPLVQVGVGERVLYASDYGGSPNIPGRVMSVTLTTDAEGNPTPTLELGETPISVPVDYIWNGLFAVQKGVLWGIVKK